MVITKRYLSDTLGLDFDIAEFFADRKVPADNLYWKGKFLYLGVNLGTLFIPIMMDAAYKSGVDKKLLIDPVRTARMEASMDIVMLFEYKRITFEEYTKRMSELYLPHVVNHDLFDDLLRFFRGEATQHFTLGSGVAALDRGDAFLFNFTDLPIDNELLRTLIKRWYYLAVSHLMMDDIADLDDDRDKGEENAIIELGDNNMALEKCQLMMEESIEGLKQTNERMASFFVKLYKLAIEAPSIQALKSKQ